MDRRLWAVLVVTGAALLTACAGMLAPEPQAPEKLFFAMQIEEEGLVIARPKLIGEAGRPLSMRLLDSESPDRTKVSLQLFPERDGAGYRVHLGLMLPDREEPAIGELALLHGEERRLLLADAERPIHVRLLLMRVDSPEFDAYMQLARRELERQTS